MKKIDKARFTGSYHVPHFKFWRQWLPEFYEPFVFQQLHANSTFSGEGRGELTFEFGEAESSLLIRMAKDSDAGIFTILTLGWAVLLSRYTGQRNIIINTPLFQDALDGEVIEDQVPLLIKIVPTESIKDHLNRIKSIITESYRYQNFPIGLISGEHERQFHSNTTLSYAGLHSLDAKKESDCDVSVQRNGASIAIKINYSKRHFHNDFIGRISGHWNRLLSYLTDLNQPVDEIDILTEGEKDLLLHDLNNTCRDFSTNCTVIQLFEKQVNNNPEDKALVFEGNPLNYQELNVLSNRLARYLQNMYAIQPEHRIAVLMPRSESMIVALLGILKTGAAFVPIDVSYPQEMTEYILDDAEVSLIITSTEIEGVGNREVVDITALDLAGENGENLSVQTSDSNLAYMIYTSGSTGRPKGVEIQLNNFYNYVYWANDHYFNWKKHNHFPLFTPISFDLTITCIFTTLLRGDCLYIYNEKEGIIDILEDVFNPKTAVNTVKLTPSHISLLGHLSLDRTNVNTIITGGEALQKAQVNLLKHLNPLIKIYNEYGPTEATVGCTVKLVDNGESFTIGQPIANTSIYLLDDASRLVPPGMPGEIAVAGAGVARGYWKKPVLTAERFIHAEFEPGKKLYRTGDMGQWLPNGELNYLGRNDSQVKIRGNRVELSEIECVIQQLDGIDEAVVTTTEDNNGAKSLVAYYKSNDILSKDQVRALLKEILPDYKVPTYIVQTENFPLTPNGKVDFKSLLKLLHQPDHAYVAPQNLKEKAIADVWALILGHQQVSVEDNFFTIGGDSIKAIQVSSQLYQRGWQVRVKDILRYPTVRQLSGYVTEVTTCNSRGAVEGVVPLTPIQKEFFSSGKRFENHFNFALMFKVGRRLKKQAVETIFRKIQEHHDALRITFSRTDGEVTSYNHGCNHPFYMEVHDLTGFSKPSEVLEMKAGELQKGLDLERGPLMKLALFHLSDGDRLLVVIHHLVMDVVSWRIIFEDVETLLHQYEAGDELLLPFKTTSFKDWSETLAAHANNPEFIREELPYWESVCATKVPRILSDHKVPTSFVKDSEKLLIEIDEAESSRLLYEVPGEWNTEINDILVAALAMAVKNSFGVSPVALDIEGHGREEIAEDINLTRTVGYFTTTYPVVLSVQTDNPVEQVQETKEQLRKVPAKGIGYGMIRHLTAGNPLGANIILPQICFNYFGQFDEDVNRLSLDLAPESTGAMQNPLEIRHRYDFYITGYVESKKLTLRIEFSTKQHGKETVQRFADAFKHYLQRILSAQANKTELVANPNAI